MPKNPTVLGIDPGSHHMGYGIISQEGSRLIYIASGSFNPPKKDPLEQRLHYMQTQLQKVIASHSLDALAVESIFYAKNVKSALTLAHARAVALLAAAQNKLSFAEYSPLEVKTACTGYGRASKEQVSTMIGHLFPKFSSQDKLMDETDALSVALCHLNLWKSKEKIRLADKKQSLLQNTL